MAYGMKWPRVYIYGDSLTQFAFSKDGGWASIVANNFQRRCDVIARGFSGYNSRQGRALSHFLLDDMKDASVAGIWFGANDASDPQVNPQQSVPVEEYKENLKYMIHFMQTKARIQSIFLVTPPAIDAKKWEEVCLAENKPSGRGPELLSKYVNACCETALEIDVPCVNLYQAMKEKNDWQDFLIDGLHLSQKGSEFVASKFTSLLKDLLLGQNKDVEIFPPWRLVSNDYPEKSFQCWWDSRKSYLK